MTTHVNDVVLREREGLLRLACFGHLTSAQLERFLLGGSSLTASSRRFATQQLLMGLRQRRLISAGARLVGGPAGGSTRHVYQLTPAGRRVALELDPSLRTDRAPRHAVFVEHALALAEVALAFIEAARSRPGHELREWVADRQTAALLGRSAVVPDAYMTYATRAWEVDAFVEVDLDTERPARFAQKVTGYAEMCRGGKWREGLRSWPLILIVAPSVARATVLRRVAEDLLEHRRELVGLGPAFELDFAAFPDLTGDKGPLGEIWQVAGREGLQLLIPADADVATGAEARAMQSRAPLAGTA